MAVDSNSGLAGIVYWLNAYFNLPNDEKLDKRDPFVVGIKEKVDKKYRDGRTTAMSDYELKEICKEVDLETYRRLKKILHRDDD